MWSGGVAPFICIILEGDRGEGPALGCLHFTLVKGVCVFRWIGDGVGPTSGLDVLEGSIPPPPLFLAASIAVIIYSNVVVSEESIFVI
jgi:hypothetical protein